MTVGPLSGHAEEQRPGIGRAGVVGQVAHLGRDASDDLNRRERGDQPLQVHDGRV